MTSWRVRGAGGRLRLVALIEEASVVQRILRPLELPADLPEPRPPRAPRREPRVWVEESQDAASELDESW